MRITTPDPHPGRCLNHRVGLRCLDYDGHKSACTFPDPMPEDRPYTSGQIYLINPSKPWRAPWDERKGSKA